MHNERKNNDPHDDLPVTATINAIPFVEGLVRYLAQKRCEISHLLKPSCPGWENIDTSSVETFVSGNFQFGDEEFESPFGSAFLFTCTRGHEGVYELRWSISLS